MKVVRAVLIAWLPLAVGISAIFLTLYAAVQQSYRESLNDPQIQMAEDVASALSQGAAPQTIIPDSRIDIAQSLAPWVAAYYDNGQARTSSGLLHGALPQPPKGVFDDAAQGSGKDTSRSQENRVSWEPTVEVRQAIVVVHYGTASSSAAASGYGVAGRNMREAENRVGALGSLILLGWFASMIASLIAAWLVRIWRD